MTFVRPPRQPPQRGWTLTQLSDLEDLAQHFGQLDTAPAERALVLVLPTAVLQDDLPRAQRAAGSARPVLDAP